MIFFLDFWKSAAHESATLWIDTTLKLLAAATDTPYADRETGKLVPARRSR